MQHQAVSREECNLTLRPRSKLGQSKLPAVTAAATAAARRAGSCLGGPARGFAARRPTASAICCAKLASPSAQPPLVAALSPTASMTAKSPRFSVSCRTLRSPSNQYRSRA